MLFTEFFEQTYTPICMGGLSDSHRYLMTLTINCFVRWSPTPISLNDLSDELLARYRQWLLANDKSRKTANGIVSRISMVWREAHRRKLVSDLPTLRILKVPRRNPVAWTVAEIGQLIESAQQETGMIGDIPANVWWTGLILVTYDTALRRRALMGICLADVNLESGCILVQAEYMKDGEDFIVHITEQTVAVLKFMMKQKRELLFHWSFDNHKKRSWTTFHRHARAITLRAGLDADHGFLHRIRRTTATAINIVVPGAATTMLGHNDPTMAGRFYIDRTKGVQKRFADLLPRPLDWKPSDGDISIVRPAADPSLTPHPCKFHPAIEMAKLVDRIGIVLSMPSLKIGVICELIERLNLSPTAFAKECRISKGMMNMMVNKKCGIGRRSDKRIREGLLRLQAEVVAEKKREDANLVATGDTVTQEPTTAAAPTPPTALSSGTPELPPSA